MTSKDLGLVTAYAYAVSQGYTGTEEEFAELMASYATVAEEAAESAAEAAASATAAGTSETNAAASAASATQSATAAGQSASSAFGSAVQAQASATAAGQSATQASGSATAAGNSATAAAGSATQAAASETAAGASATAAAGSATSAGDSATAAATSATEADASADRAQEILDSIPEDYSELSDDVTALKSAFKEMEQDMNTYTLGLYPQESVSGAAASFTDGADGIPAKGYTLNIEPHQEGSGDPSPDNIRAISGYTSVDVWRGGENLEPGITYTIGAYLDDNGAPVSNANFKYSNVFVPVVPGTNYVYSAYNTYIGTGRLRVHEYDANQNWLRQIVFSPGMTPNMRNNISWTASADARYIKFSTPKTVTDVFVGVASSETIPFPTEAGTVYGGTLTKNADGSGTLTVDHICVTFDGTESWSRMTQENPNGTLFYPSNFSQYGFKNWTGNASRFYECDPMSNWCKPADNVTQTTMGANQFYWTTSGNALRLVWGLPNGGSTVDELIAALAANPLQISGMIETPTVYTIPASDMAKIPTLLGDNTVWMSADGTIDLTYRADLAAYLTDKVVDTASMIAGVENGLTASKAYSAGDYLIIGKTLYKAIAAIASGATFTLGTNVQATTVGTELTALNA